MESARARLASRSSSPRGRGVVERDRSSLTEAAASRRWSGHCVEDLAMRALARSHTVSDMAQKVGGDCTQPIVQAIGRATSWGSSW